jgi:galactokinase
MKTWSGLADTALLALRQGDQRAFSKALDAGFDLRADLYGLPPAARHLVDLARAHGAAATFAGSGGAVVVVVPGPRKALVRALESTGAVVHEVEVAPAHLLQ